MVSNIGHLVFAQLNTPNPVTIVGQSAYTDDIGYFHIVGEVQNASNQTIKSVQLVVSIYDSTHTIIGTTSGYTDIDVLRPGERSAFSLSTSNIASNTPLAIISSLHHGSLQRDKKNLHSLH